MDRLTGEFKGVSMFLTSQEAKIYNRLRQYEDTGLTPEECDLYVKCQAQSVSKRELKLEKENDLLRSALEKYIKENGDDICEHCKNHIPCTPDDCDKYEEGSGGWINGQRVDDFEWSCKDFDYGTCGKMTGTPCDGCFCSDYSGFDLNLNTF